jgi:peptide/nickel transport system ATP-binding protein
VSVQAQIVNLMRGPPTQARTTMLFISHDLAVVEYICDTVVVLTLAASWRSAPSAGFPAAPSLHAGAAVGHSLPEVGAAKQRQILQGDIPSPANPPSGCVFRTRCPHAITACAEAVPLLESVGPGHVKACIRTISDLRNFNSRLHYPVMLDLTACCRRPLLAKRFRKV